MPIVSAIGKISSLDSANKRFMASIVLHPFLTTWIFVSNPVIVSPVLLVLEVDGGTYVDGWLGFRVEHAMHYT